MQNLSLVETQAGLERARWHGEKSAGADHEGDGATAQES